MTLIGHDDAWRTWDAALMASRMHHAWLLAGQQGLGKAHFARAAAAALVAEPGVHQPAPGAHPDILLLEPLPDGEDEARKHAEGLPHRTRRNVTVEQARALQTRLTTRPTLGARRAVIIDAIDDLERGAINALLKSLEEPPTGTVFLLVAHRPGRLIATVRSRCRVLRFPPLVDPAVEAVVAGAAADAEPRARDAAVLAARGSPGVALTYLGRDIGVAVALMRRMLAEGDRDLALRAALATTLGTRIDRERLLAVLDLARALLTEALVATSRARQAAIISAYGRVESLAARAPTYNYDPALLLAEIGGLLASVAMATDRVGVA